GARAASAATTDEARRAGRAPGVGRRRREERAAIWQRGCRRPPPGRSPQPPCLLGQPPTSRLPTIDRILLDVRGLAASALDRHPLRAACLDRPSAAAERDRDRSV